MINTIKHLIKSGMLSSQFYIPKRHELIIITDNNNNNNNNNNNYTSVVLVNYN